MARPSHAPDPASRRQVEALAGYGIPEPEIAGLIGIDAKTLRKHYRTELDQGHTKANARVAENLFKKATGEGKEAVTAAIFWLKARAGWREVQRHEHAGVPHQPITEIRRIILSPLKPLEPAVTIEAEKAGDAQDAGYNRSDPAAARMINGGRRWD